MNVITYSLRNGLENSNLFYQQLADFTDTVLVRWERDAAFILTGYKQFIEFGHIEALRSDEEYIYDLLNLGVLWNVYRYRAQSLNPVTGWLLIKLYALRRRNKSLKPYIDKVRGLLATMFLNSKPHFKLSTNTLQKLILFLDASSEYREEVKRFQIIAEYIDTLPLTEQNLIIITLAKFAQWFETKSRLYFNDYTENVNTYLRTTLPEHKWQEDYFFCGRKQVEYHASMVGAELMNRAFKNQFAQTEHRALLLPACMRAKQGGECQAKKISLDYQCSGCTANCRINQYAKLGRQFNFEVHIIPHSSDFTTWLRTFAMNKNIGVVGVACLLNLITGGLELKALDMPAQCILLDYCGCTNHWDKQGIATDINKDQLIKILAQAGSINEQMRECA